MRELFKQADKNNDNALNLKEINALLKYLNIEVDMEMAKTVFEVREDVAQFMTFG